MKEKSKQIQIFKLVFKGFECYCTQIRQWHEKINEISKINSRDYSKQLQEYERSKAIKEDELQRVINRIF